MHIKGLLLAEKPSVMRAIKAVYDKNPKVLGSDTLDFAAFHGHLMELAEPGYYNESWKQWRASDLPMLPKEFVYLPQDKKSVSELLNRIKTGKYDFLVNACDAGREGEHIFWSFYEANKLKLPVKRFWASDVTDKSIKAALGGLRDSKEFDGLRKAARYRAQLDWLAGMNYSRAVTLGTGRKINVGRVISPTLKLIVDREEEIKNFKSEDFFEVPVTFKHKNGEYTGTYMLPPALTSSRFSDEKKAKAVQTAAQAAKKAVISKITHTKSSIPAPTLYSLTELQKDANKYLGLKASESLAIAQTLYEKKLLTYPRTESRVLPSAMTTEIEKHLKVIGTIPELAGHVKALTPATIASVMKDKTYINDAKVTDHHAIIPTTDTPNLSALSATEKSVYLLVAKRLLSIFLPPYITSNTVMLTNIDDMVFRSTGKTEIDKGWTVLYTSKKVDNELPGASEKDEVQVVSANLHKGATKPPQRYTTKTLLDAMTNIGQSLSQSELRKIMRDNSGIGTPATRAEILDKLERTDMVSIQKNYFVPTDFGMEIISVIGNREICSPALTAMWEQKLRSVEQETYKGDLRGEIDAYVSAETKDILGDKLPRLSSDGEVVGKCPNCGKNVVLRGSLCCCEDYVPAKNRVDGVAYCGFAFGMNRTNPALTADDAKTLLANGTLPEHDLTSFDGKVQHGKLQLVCGSNGSYFLTAIDSVPESPKAFLGTCPKCGGKVYEGSRFFVCSNKDKGCDFGIAKSIKGGKVKASDIKALLAGKETGKIKFVWNSGKSGEARLKLEGASLKFVFDNDKPKSA